MKLSGGAKVPRPLSLLAAGLLVSQMICLPALATLGEDVTTVESDRAQMKAQVRATAVAGYTVKEIQTPTQTTVREYVSAAGKVFAVTWQGPLLPDFKQMLGRYFEQYRNNASSPRVGRRQLTINGSDLVVSSHGRMRAFSGFAYVPSLLPPNFSPDELK